jgi:thiol-disulfide isomerase/thioredoxin
VRLGEYGGAPEKPRDIAWREALKRLAAYSDQPVLIEILRYLDSGSFKPETEAVLRSLSKDRDAHPAVRDFSELMIARCMLSARNYHESLTRRSQELEAGDKPRWSSEKQYVQQQLAGLPSPAVLQKSEMAACDILRRLSLSESAKNQRQSAVKNIDPDWRLIELDIERTKTMPRISELAEGELFKESHLRIGKSAEDLKVTLLSGNEWSLAAQRGRVVIIQFSFKGCGPCEEMYPVLRQVQQTHGDRVSILSIMADENRGDTEQAVTDGKLTWNIYWDRHRGPVATRWAVLGFPTVYVIDRNGQIAAVGPRRDDLKKTVAELLK